MTITQLRYIIALEKHRNFVKAAKSCQVTQPALTAQIRKLEEELDVIIFDRTHKPVVPTPEGESLIRQAKVVLKEAKYFEDLAEDFSSSYKGRLTIGIIPTVSPYLLPLFLDTFQKKYPDIQLHIREEITEKIIEGLNQNRLDAGIVATPVLGTSFPVKPLFYERFYLYVSEHHPMASRDVIDIEAIEASDIWLLTEGNCFRNQVDFICQRVENFHQKSTFLYESSSIESLRRIVENRHGITFLPELATIGIPSERENMVKTIADIEPVREISLIMRSTQIKKTLTDRLAEEIINQVPNQMRYQSDRPIIKTDIRA